MPTPAKLPQAKRVPLISPIGGIVRTNAREQQRTSPGPQGEPPTCWNAVNVLPYDSFGRARVAQRFGIKKKYTTQMGDGTHQVQGMSELNALNYSSVGSVIVTPAALPIVPASLPGNFPNTPITTTQFTYPNPVFELFVGTLTATSTNSSGIIFDVSGWNRQNFAGDSNTPALELELIQTMAIGSATIANPTSPVFFTAPTLSFSGGTVVAGSTLPVAAGVLAATGGITAYSITVPGSSYGVGNVVTVTGGGGSGASGVVSTTGGSGQVTAISFTGHPGSGYTGAATLSIAGGSGTFAATALPSFGLASVTFSTTGNGYRTLPSATLASSAAVPPNPYVNGISGIPAITVTPLGSGGLTVLMADVQSVITSLATTGGVAHVYGALAWQGNKWAVYLNTSKAALFATIKPLFGLIDPMFGNASALVSSSPVVPNTPVAQYAGASNAVFADLAYP